jgi:hypothetical protein
MAETSPGGSRLGASYECNHVQVPSDRNRARNRVLAALRVMWGPLAVAASPGMESHRPARSARCVKEAASPGSLAPVHRIGGRFPLSTTQPSRHRFGGVECARWTPSTHRPMIRTVCPADGCDLNEVARRRCLTAQVERGFNGACLAVCSANGKFRPA